MAMTRKTLALATTACGAGSVRTSRACANAAEGNTAVTAVTQRKGSRFSRPPSGRAR